MRSILNPSIERGSVAEEAPESHSATPSLEEGGAELRLLDVPLNQRVELVGIDLPEGQLEQLFERGVLPGCFLRTVRRSPSGDPIVSVDGTLLALRREMADCIRVRLVPDRED